MAGFGDIVQKAFYLGVGLAAYASEKAGGKLSELRSQIQNLADDMVAKGEMNTEEARRFVEDMMKQAQQSPKSSQPQEQKPPSEPRLIEILEEDDGETVQASPSVNAPNDVEQLRDQVSQLQEQLKNLQRGK